MPKTKISEYSTTNSDNTDIESINIAEGCAPSGINNAIRELMVHLKEFQTGASGDAFTFAGGVLISGTANTITGNVLMSGTNTITGSTTATFAAGAVGTPSIAAHGDTNTGIFFPAADTIAFGEGGAEAMRINSSGFVGIGTSSPGTKLEVKDGFISTYDATNANGAGYSIRFYTDANAGSKAEVGRIGALQEGAVNNGTIVFATSSSGSVTERMRIDSSGNVLVGSSTSAGSNIKLQVYDNSNSGQIALMRDAGGQRGTLFYGRLNSGTFQETARIGCDSDSASPNNGILYFYTSNSSGTSTERVRITSGGVLLVGKTATGTATAGAEIWNNGQGVFTVSGDEVGIFNRSTNDGTIISLRQDNTTEGTISVSGNTVSYNAFTGGHWTQLQEGRGYNPEILRGTVMSSIGEMSEWKSVTWTETIEHPAIPAVEAKEAVVDEEGNVVEPAVEAVEGKDAWTESIPHREAYLGNLPVGATFEEDGFTKTVVDDGNERLPKVKISDVVGDKAVYGVFQTYDEVQDMLITSLGAFVVRIASGVTVQIGDLLESNGDGCAKVQDDDVIRSKTIGKVTSTVATATYPDGSYTVPCVIYCG